MKYYTFFIRTGGSFLLKI